MADRRSRQNQNASIFQPWDLHFGRGSSYRDQQSGSSAKLASPDLSSCSNHLSGPSNYTSDSSTSTSKTLNSMVKIIDVQRHKPARGAVGESLAGGDLWRPREAPEPTFSGSQLELEMDQPGVETREWSNLGDFSAWNSNSRNQQQQQQQQVSQTSNSPAGNNPRPSTSNRQQVKQHSGETLSSFESDYDLLLYLGETETEDIVDTERSCDYQDQTWRQSICGASLAPTIDESLSELTNYNPNHLLSSQTATPAELDAVGQPLNTASQFSLSNSPFGSSARYSPANNQKSNASWNRPSSSTGTSNTANYQSAASSPPPPLPVSNRIKRLQRVELDTESRDERDNEISLVLDNSLLKSLNNRYHQESPVENPNQKLGYVGNKLASLFNKKQPTGADRMAASRSQPDSSFQSETGELDRLLAEMSQTLDLDSLARFDPKRGERESASQTLSRFQGRTPEAIQLGKSLDRRKQPSEEKYLADGRRPLTRGSLPGHQQASSRPVQASNESILDDYDGASRILEQMLNDQLMLSGCAVESLAAPPSPKVATKKTTSPEPEVARKLSTCSSSITTTEQSSVVAAPSQPKQTPRREPSLYENRSVWKHRRSNRAAAAAGPKRENSAQQVLASPPTELAKSTNSRETMIQAQTPSRLKPNRRLESSSSEDEAKADPRVPPPPPIVDYGDEQEVIRVEPADIPLSDTSDHEERKENQMDRMKRRTLSSMRSMRNKLTDFMADNHRKTPATARGSQPNNHLQPLAPPRPPKRSSSFGSIRSQQSTGPGKRNKEPETKPLKTERISRRDLAGQQSLGKQIRERLSRSKSRFVDRFLRPKRAQSQPNAQPEASVEIDGELFQPGDIARNSDIHSGLGAKKVNGSVDKDPVEVAEERRRSASESSALSGLEETTSGTRHRTPRRHERRRSKSKDRRSSSLLSMKRLSALRPGRAAEQVEDLDSMKSPATTGDVSSPERASKRQTKNSPVPVRAARRNDQEYFARVTPPLTEQFVKIKHTTEEGTDNPLPEKESPSFPDSRHDEQPKLVWPSESAKKVSRSQSMRAILERNSASELDTKQQRATADKRTVSFTNLNARRVPSSTNTFRPGSALADAEEVAAEGKRIRPESVAAIAIAPKPVGTNGIVRIDEPLEIRIEQASPEARPRTSSSPFARGASVFSELKSKCNELFGSGSSPRERQNSPALVGESGLEIPEVAKPRRPPRRRSKSVGKLEGEESVIELAPASPNSSLTLAPGSEVFSRGNARGSNKLSSLAHHFKHSAADFFTGNNDADRRSKSCRPVRPAPRPPAPEAAKEPQLCAWQPVIKVAEGPKRSVLGNLMGSAVGGGGRKPTSKEAERRAEPDEAHQQQPARSLLVAAAAAAATTRQSLDTDSTWESSGGELEEAELAPADSAAGRAGSSAAAASQPVGVVEPKPASWLSIDSQGSAGGGGAELVIPVEQTADASRLRDSSEGAQPENKWKQMEPNNNDVLLPPASQPDGKILVGQGRAHGTGESQQQSSRLPRARQQAAASKTQRNSREPHQPGTVARSHDVEIPQDLHRIEICKTPFQFNANLPTPAQLLRSNQQETENLRSNIGAESNLQAPARGEPEKFEQASVMTAAPLRDNQAEATDQQQQQQENRLSVYENVEPSTPTERASPPRGWRKPPTPPHKPARLAEAGRRRALNASPPDSPASWSIADDDAGPPAKPDPGALASRIQLQRQAVEGVVAEERVAERPRRQLVTMTSIFQEPNDELMNGSSATRDNLTQAQAQAQYQNSRRDSMFANEEENDNNSDSENSFATASANRRRLLTTLNPMLARSGSASHEAARSSSKPAESDQLPPEEKPSALRRGGPQSSSLVMRMARNFDQTIQEQAAAASSSSGRQKVSGGRQLSATSLDEPTKSESSWYDAKAAVEGEQLDEAEVAAFLRDFDRQEEHSSDRRTARGKLSTRELSNVSGSLDGLSSVSTGADPFVTVADSTTVEDDLALAGEEASADDTLNDGEQSMDELEELCELNETGSECRAPANEQLEEAISGLSLARREPGEQQRQQQGNESGESFAAWRETGDKINSCGPLRIERCEKATSELPQPPAATDTPKEQNNRPASESAGGAGTACASKDATTAANSHRGSADAGKQQKQQQREQSAPASNSSLNQTREGKPLIDNSFKNSLNNIIARRSSQQQQQHQPQQPVEEERGQEQDKLIRSPTGKLEVKAKELSGAAGTDQTMTTASMASNKQSDGNKKESIKCRELKGLTKYCQAILRHGRRAKRSKNRDKDKIGPEGASGQAEKTINVNEYLPLSTSSSSSAASSGASSAASSDDEQEAPGASEAEANDRELVRAAKKCSRLYEELERILANRAARKEPQPNLIDLDTPAREPKIPGNQFEQHDEADEADEADEEEGTELGGSCSELDRLSALTEPEDRISLSSSSVSSESLPEIRQRKNLQKLYCVVNEIYSSEAKFVDTLRLLNEDFRAHVLTANSASGSSSDLHHSSSSGSLVSHKSSANIPPETLNSLLKHLPQLQALNENLLAELKLARDQWPKSQKIAHVLVKIGPFLKHYSTYIREFEGMSHQLQECQKKFPHFAERVRDFEASPRSQKLTIQHHLLKPIQRIPQYRLLLQQYLHHLKPDDVDYEDTVNALEVVSRVAEHANQSMSEGANFAKLLALQAKIVGKQKNIVQPGRLFVKEGELMKVCRKQIQPRWFVLLNDVLLYLTQIQSSDILYLNKELPLDDCTVTIPETEEQVRGNKSDHFEREFNVCTKTRAFALIAKSRAERDDWVQTFRDTIEEHMARRRSFSVRQQQLFASSPSAVMFATPNNLEEPLSSLSTNPNHLLGQKAPLWTPDSRVTMCQSCTSSFSAIFRRHHCRACGKVVCSACSSNKAPLIYLKCRSARVCDQCFDILKANIHLYYLPTSAASLNSQITQAGSPEGASGADGYQPRVVNEQELKRLDELFRTLLKSQFVRHARLHGLSRLLKF